MLQYQPSANEGQQPTPWRCNMLQYNHKAQCLLEKGSHKTLNSGQLTAAFLKLKVKSDLSSS